MKFGQLLEYGIRNTFLVKSYKKYGGEASLRPFFYEKSRLDQQSEVLWML